MLKTTTGGSCCSAVSLQHVVRDRAPQKTEARADVTENVLAGLLTPQRLLNAHPRKAARLSTAARGAWRLLGPGVDQARHSPHSGRLQERVYCRLRLNGAPPVLERPAQPRASSQTGPRHRHAASCHAPLRFSSAPLWAMTRFRKRAKRAGLRSVCRAA